MYRSIIIAATALSFAALGSAQLPYARFMDPRDTFLRTNNDPDAQDAAPISLADLGLQPGDTIRITRMGDFAVSPNPGFFDNATNLMGIFSASDILLANTVLNRVPDAIDAGPDILTLSTLIGGLTTDIVEDFRISAYGDPQPSRTLSMTIPVGATHLFLGVNDAFFGDNFDADGDYRVEITGERAVLIDVKPTVTDNAINLGSGIVPVALLGSSSLDVLTVDPATIRFAGAAVRTKNNGTLHYEMLDVNGDGYADLLLHFSVSALTLAPTATTATLTGATFGGLQLVGSDAIRIVP